MVKSERIAEFANFRRITWSASMSEKFHLANPGRPEHDLTQAVYKLFCSVGMSFVVFGPGTADQVFTEASRVAPVFNSVEPVGGGFGLIMGHRSLPCAVLSGAGGSAITLFGHPEVDTRFLIKEVADPIKDVRHPWGWTAFFGDESSNRSAVQLIDDARAVPVWDLTPFRHLAP